MHAMKMAQAGTRLKSGSQQAREAIAAADPIASVSRYASLDPRLLKKHAGAERWS